MQPAAPAVSAHAWRVIAGYVALTLVVAWPLPAHLGTAVGGDYGDSVLNTWIVDWAAEHLTAILRGHPGAWAAMWTAPPFAPEPNTFTYSEHLIGPTLMVLPLRWAGAGSLPIYNVALLLTIALTGVAAHRLTVHLVGSHIAGAVAGVLCTYNDYRFFWSLAHIQTLSVQWWVFALWGLDVFVARTSWPALAGATVSLVMLHLSSSYLTAYAAPFTAAFTLWSMARHGRLRDRGVWGGIALAGVLPVVAVAPILKRYLDASAALGFTRSLEEIAAQSATMAAYGLIAPWFAPLVALGVAGVAVGSDARGMTRTARAALLAMAVAGMALTFGPNIQLGDSVWPGPYRLFLAYVPGFSGLRVPHRYLVVTNTLLAVLAGFAAARAARWRSGLGLVPVVIAVALVTRTAWSTSFPMDRVIPPVGFETPPAYLRPSAALPGIYQAVASLPADATAVEFPFGELAYEVRYTFFTGAHRRRILNGYSGVLPPSYLERQPALRDPLVDPDRAWALVSGATHAVVHPAAWKDDHGQRIRAWLESHGARVVAEHDGAWLFELGARGSGPGVTD